MFSAWDALKRGGMAGLGATQVVLGVPDLESLAVAADSRIADIRLGGRARQGSSD